MRIGLMGFGKTGKAVANAILQHSDFTLVWAIRRKKIMDNRSVAEFLGIEMEGGGHIFSSETKNVEVLLTKYPVDIIIDFSSSKGIWYYGAEASKRGIKIISAISHYEEDDLKFLTSLSVQSTVFWSPNITIGINFLLLSSKYLKKIAPTADIEIIEEHFKQKEGVSGTALKIAEALEINKSDINTVRAGGIVGKHEIIFGFPYQTVRLIHESISREAFGNGVIFVAQNLQDKGVGFFNFEELLEPYFRG
jgi:4-hydroxy-tetrahydrodipicolinate reductase